METIENKKEITAQTLNQPARRSVYLTEYKIPVNTDLQNADEVRYAAQTQLFKKAKTQFYALQPLPEPPESMFKNALKQSRGFVAGGVNMAQKGFNALLTMAQQMNYRNENQEALIRLTLPKAQSEERKKMFEDYDAIPSAEKLRAHEELILELNEKQQKFLEAAGLAKTDKDGFLYDLSHGASSLAGAIGLMAVLKSPAMVGVAFGAVEGQGTYEDALKSGIRGKKALAIGAAVGTWIAATEMFGTQLLWGALNGKGILSKQTANIMKRFSGTSVAAKKILTPIVAGAGTAIVEGSQEFTQDTGSGFIRKIAGVDDTTVFEIIQDGLYSFLIGGILGSVPGTVGAAANMKATAQKMQADLERAGMDKATAAEIATETARQAISDNFIDETFTLIRKENSPLTYEDNDINKSIENTKIAIDQELAKRLDPAERAKAANEVWNIQDAIKEVALGAGLPEVDAQAQAVSYATAARLYYENTGTTPREWFETHKLDISNKMKSVSPVGSDVFKQAARDLTKTTQFKEWFGDSKVVDGKGRPLVVYHGSPDIRFAKNTDTAQFQSRNGAFFFAKDRKIAKTYADPKRAFDYQNAEPGIVATYLSIQNPMTIEYNGNRWQAHKEEYIKEAKEKGHDGILLKNIRDAYNPDGSQITDVYVVFEPTQIKSVDNQGTFDPNNPNIYYQSGQDNIFMPAPAEVQKYKSDLEKALNGALPHGRFISVGQTPFVYKGFGLNKGSLNLPINVVNKATKTKHNVPLQAIEKLPQLIANPVAIFKSATEEGSLVAVLNQKDNNGDQVIAILKPAGDKINVIPSVYGKSNFDNFVRKNAESGNALYLDEEQALKTIRQNELQLLKQDSLKGSMNIIRTKEDIVNTFNQSGANKQPPRARVTFTPLGAFMELLERADASSALHEISGHVLFRTLEEIRSEIETNGGGTKEFMDIWGKVEAWLGPAQRIEQEDGKIIYRFNEDQHEEFAENMVKFFAAGKAPTTALQRIFDYFKEMLRDLVADASEFMELRPEIKDIFDSIFADSGILSVDAAQFKGQTDNVKTLAERIRKGEAATINDMGLKEVKSLLQQTNRRRPAAPKDNLLKDLKKNGANFNSAGLVDKEAYQNAGIKNNPQGITDELYLKLADWGYMAEGDTSLMTAEQLDNLNREAAELIERALSGETIYRLEDANRVAEIENFDENIRTIREAFGNNIQDVEDTLRAINALEEKGYRVVGNADIEYVEGESEQLLTFAETEAQLNSEIERLEKENEQLKETAERRLKEAGHAKREGREEAQAAQKAAALEKETFAAQNKLKENLKKANRIRTALINEINKRELENKETLLKPLKEAKTAQNIFDASYTLLGRLEQTYKNTEAGQAEQSRLEVPGTNWEAKKISLLKEFTDITAAAEDNTKKAMDLIKLEGRARRGQITLTQEEKAQIAKAKEIVKKNIESKYIKAFENSLRNEPHIESADILKFSKYFASQSAKFDLIKDRQIDDFIRRTQEIQTYNYKKYIAGKINKLLSSKLYEKAGAVRRAKYNSEVMAFLTVAKENWALTQKEAEAKYEAMMKSYSPENPPSPAEALAAQVLDFKVLGNYQDMESAKELYDDIYTLLKNDRKDKRNEKLKRQINEEGLKLLLRQSLRERKLPKGFIKQFIQRGGTDLQTAISVLFGEYKYQLPNESAPGLKTHKINFRDVLAPELSQMAEQEFKLKGDQALNQIIADAYGFKTSNQILEKRSEMQKEKMDVVNYSYVRREEEGQVVAAILKDGKWISDNKPRMQSVNKLNIIAFWIWNQNHEFVATKNGSKDIGLAGRLMRAYGEEQLNEMFATLTEQDLKLAKNLMELVQKHYEAESKVHKRLYGFSLPVVENYFPSVADRISGGDFDFAVEFAANGKAPGFIKERAKSDKVIQKLVNPLGVAKTHLRRAAEFIFNAEKFSELRRIFRNSEMESAFMEKFGQEDGVKIYQKILSLIDQQGPQKAQAKGEGYKITNNVFNNLVKTAMGLKVVTGFKQFLSSVSFMENMPTHKWLQYFYEGLRKPVDTSRYMLDNVPYIRTRYQSAGINEAVARAAASQDDISTFAEKYNNFTNLMLVNLRLGDAGSFIYGGYPYMKYLVQDKGMTPQEAANEVAKHGARTLQSPLPVHLSQTQADAQGVMKRLVVLFRNQQMQYIRRVTDNWVAYKNGEVTLKQFGKTAYLYLILNPLLYELAGLAWLTSGDDDDEQEKALWNLALSPLGNTASAYFMGDFAVDFLADNAINLIYGDKLKAPYSTGTFFIEDIFSDIKKGVARFNAEEDITATDFIEAAVQLSKYAGLPISTVRSIGKGFIEAAQGNVGKGLLQIVGYTENRAAKVTGTEISNKKNKKNLRKN